MQAGRPADAAAIFGAVADQTNDPRAAVARGEALQAAHQPAATAKASARPWPARTCRRRCARAYAALGYAQDAGGDPAAAAASWQGALWLGADRGLAVAEAEVLLRAGHPREATAVLAALNAPGQNATGAAGRAGSPPRAGAGRRRRGPDPRRGAGARRTHPRTPDPPRPGAHRAYAEAIQRTAAYAAATGDPRGQAVLQGLRAEDAAATQQFAFELVDTLCAPTTTIGCGVALPIVERLGSAGIGAATAAWSPHIPGDSDPQRIALYARLLWSNDPGSVSILSRTLQGGAGIRVQPFNGIPVYAWAEHLFAIGGESQDNWLLRVTAGWETGAAWRAGGTPDWGAA